MTLLLYGALNKKIFKKYEEKPSKLSFTFCRRSNGYTPLHRAAGGGALDVVKYLIEKGADFRAISNDGATPLSLATKEGHLDIVKYIMEKGA